MKKMLFIVVMAVSVPFITLAQTINPGTVIPVVALPVSGLVPGDFFYFLDRWGEVFNLAVTFNKEKKARAYLEYAKERVSEAKDVLKSLDAKLEDITSSKNDFDEQVARAVALVKSEKNNNRDVADLAREIDNELDFSRAELKSIFKDYKNKSSQAEEIIRVKLASLLAGDPQIAGLTQALESVIKEKYDAERKEKDIDTDLNDEQEILEDAMGEEMSARKHMDEVMFLRARLEGLAVQLPQDVILYSQDLLNKAKDAEIRGDFEVAKQLSKQAKKILEKVQDAVEENAHKMKEAQEDSENKEDTEDSEIVDVSEMRVDYLEEEIKLVAPQKVSSGPKIFIGGQKITVTIANTEELQGKGLSGRKNLKSNEGMLFVFPKSGDYGFWMKDMLFPIDIIWFDANRKIVDVWERAEPGSYPKVVTSRTPAKFVLEVPAGFWGEYNLQKGDVFRFIK